MNAKRMCPTEDKTKGSQELAHSHKYKLIDAALINIDIFRKNLFFLVSAINSIQQKIPDVENGDIHFYLCLITKHIRR